MTQRDGALLSRPAEHLSGRRVERKIALVDEAEEHDARDELRRRGERDAPVGGEVLVHPLEDLLAVAVVDREPHPGDAGPLECRPRDRVDAREPIVADGGGIVIVVAAACAEYRCDEDRRDPSPRQIAFHIRAPSRSWFGSSRDTRDSSSKSAAAP